MGQSSIPFGLRPRRHYFFVYPENGRVALGLLRLATWSTPRKSKPHEGGSHVTGALSSQKFPFAPPTEDTPVLDSALAYINGPATGAFKAIMARGR